MAQPNKKHPIEYLFAHNLFVTSIIIINSIYLAVLIKNISLSKIFNLEEIYKSSSLKYHFLILQTALFFAFILFSKNFLNILKDHTKEGQPFVFSKLHGNNIFALIPYVLSKLYDNNEINTTNHTINDKKAYQKIKVIIQNKNNESGKKEFCKNFGKLSVFKFAFYCVSMFIAFEILLFLNFVCKKFFESNIIDNIYKVFSIFLISITIFSIALDITQLIILNFSESQKLDNFQNSLNEIGQKTQKFENGINSIFKPLNDLCTKLLEKIDKRFGTNIKNFFLISDCQISIPFKEAISVSIECASVAEINIAVEETLHN
jgi:hypothetical protein